ncbi:MAG: hypothetical protein V3V75_01145, partial [Thermoguttaceae bacterium]
MNNTHPSKQPPIFQSELALWFGAVTSLLFAVFGQRWLGDLSNTGWYAGLFTGLFLVMLWLSFAVVRHADCLAIKLGEPYGTLI